MEIHRLKKEITKPQKYIERIIPIKIIGQLPPWASPMVSSMVRMRNL
jgi:hypothetical protein